MGNNYAGCSTTIQSTFCLIKEAAWEKKKKISKSSITCEIKPNDSPDFKVKFQILLCYHLNQSMGVKCLQDQTSGVNLKLKHALLLKKS